MCCVLDIIIVGNGKMGFSLADQLASEDHSITIVDTHEAALRRASDTLDVMSVKGNGVSLPPSFEKLGQSTPIC